MATTERKSEPAGRQTGSNYIQNPKNDYRQKKPTLGLRDVWEFLLKLIIAILIIIAWVIYFRMQERVGPFAWIIFIVLILLILWLILRQRHFISLKCALTAPNGCIQGYTDIISGKTLEPVVGSAYGWGFAHYIIEVRDPDGNLLSDVVIYADGSGLPDTSLIQGNFAKVNATLGWVDVEKAANDAGIILLTSTTFEITLRVFGVDGSEKLPNCKISFSLEANEVFIKQAGGATSNNYVNPDEPLKWGVELSTIGGSITIRGSAKVYGCSVEKIAEYTLWMIKDDNFSFAQPAINAAIVPGGSWYQVANIKFNGGTGFTPDQERGYNELDGDPVPSILTNNWGTRQECIHVHVDSMWIPFCYTIPSLNPFYYNTGLLPKLDPIHEINGTGKFTILLQVIDTNGNRYYDVQRAWIDNEPIHALINGIAGLSPCTDLFTKDSAGKFKTVQITGTAWDQLIDLADATIPTSDNFGHYEVHFNKQGAASGWQLLKSSADPVPARPDPVGTGTLSDWELKTLDKATNPDGRPLDQLLASGEGCTYDIRLYVCDKTFVSESGVTHYDYKYFPLKIINAAH
jgi:hypothetical protein